VPVGRITENIAKFILVKCLGFFEPVPGTLRVVRYVPEAAQIFLGRTDERGITLRRPPCFGLFFDRVVTDRSQRAHPLVLVEPAEALFPVEEAVSFPK